jgi:hypothetical protein
MSYKYDRLKQEIVQAMEALAQYQSEGTKAIEECARILGVGEEYLRQYIDIKEINQIDFLYNVEAETWFSDEDMLEYAYTTFPFLSSAENSI